MKTKNSKTKPKRKQRKAPGKVVRSKLGSKLVNALLEGSDLDWESESEAAEDEAAKHMAFWKRDQFPFISCGQVQAWAEDQGLCELDLVQVDGQWVKPLLVTSVDQGLKIKAALEKLEAERQQALKTLEAGFMARLPIRL